MKRFVILFVVSMMSLVGCGLSNQNEDVSDMSITAYILEIEDRILVNEHITGEEFEKKSANEIQDEYYYSSIFVDVSAVDQSVISKLEVGQKVKIGIKDGIRESAPAQATANKIEIVEE
ncbi:DUF3221 domain-containing protein [Bacillus nitroreducens]